MNRLLLEPSELKETTTVLGPEDRRSKYVREQIWRKKKTTNLRVGVVDGGTGDCGAFIMDDGSLVLETKDLPQEEAPRPPIDLLLALPAPLRLKRMLPVIAMLGVDHLWLVGTARVDRTYFGSTLLRGLPRDNTVKESEGELRSLFIEGAEQSGLTAIPKLAIAASLPGALEAIDRSYALKCAAHPDRGDDYEAFDDANNVAVTIPRSRPITDLQSPEETDPRRAILAIGPDRGFEEPEELRLFEEYGYDLVTLGGGLGRRTLRTDVALVALLSVLRETLGGEQQKIN